MPFRQCLRYLGGLARGELGRYSEQARLGWLVGELSVQNPINFLQILIFPAILPMLDAVEILNCEAAVPGKLNAGPVFGLFQALDRMLAEVMRFFDKLLGVFEQAFRMR